MTQTLYERIEGLKVEPDKRYQAYEAPIWNAAIDAALHEVVKEYEGVDGLAEAINSIEYDGAREILNQDGSRVGISKSGLEKVLQAARIQLKRQGE